MSPTYHNSTNPSTMDAASTSSNSSSAAAACSVSSDCTNIKSPYKAANSSNVFFNLHCSTDFPGSDLTGVYAYSFEECMNTCATYNDIRTDEGSQGVPCYGVSFDPTMTILAGNCFLKGRNDSNPVAKSVTSSALLTKSPS